MSSQKILIYLILMMMSGKNGEVEMDDDESLEIDEDELISFMNEFFLINDHVPPAEMF
jgi:hypothetical protein